MQLATAAMVGGSRGWKDLGPGLDLAGARSRSVRSFLTLKRELGLVFLWARSNRYFKKVRFCQKSSTSASFSIASFHPVNRPTNLRVVMATNPTKSTTTTNCHGTFLHSSRHHDKRRNIQLRYVIYDVSTSLVSSGGSHLQLIAV
jgi:hypothetical protein